MALGFVNSVTPTT